MDKQARFAIGTVFKPVGRYSKICTVSDIHRTYNEAGELVFLRYVAKHEFMGQTVIERDICEATIARGLMSQPVA